MKLKHEVFTKNMAGLAWGFCVSPDSCDNPLHYESFLRFSAITESVSGQSVTHVLLDEEQNRIAGYVSLRATSLVSEGENGKKYVRPAIEIAELAVDKEYERQGIGGDLVGMSILLAYKLKSLIGIRSVLVCADPKAVDFYIKKDFELLSSIYEVLHDGWNDNCTPMYIEFPEEMD